MSDQKPDLASYPRINPVFTPVVLDENEVHFSSGPWSGPVFEIVDEDRDGTLADLISLLDGSTHVQDIIESFPREDRDDAAGVIRALQAKSIVRDASDPVGEEQAKLGAYLSLVDDDEISLKRISDASLVVVGSGTVGEAVVDCLFEADVGDIGYVDLSGDLSEPLSVPEGTEFTQIEESRLTDQVDSCDFAVVATDRPYPSIASRMNEVTHETETPWTTAVVNGLDGRVGPTVYPGETACYECFQTRADAATESRIGYERLAKAKITTSLVPSFAYVVAGMVTLDVLEQLVGGIGITTGSVVVYDFNEFAVQADEVLRMPRCDVCGKSAERLDSPRHMTLAHLVERGTEEE